VSNQYKRSIEEFLTEDNTFIENSSVSELSDTASILERSRRARSQSRICSESSTRLRAPSATPSQRRYLYKPINNWLLSANKLITIVKPLIFDGLLQKIYLIKLNKILRIILNYDKLNYEKGS
jgi:hypothetical protein